MKRAGSIKMKYPTYVEGPGSDRRCGNCGKIYPKEEFKKKGKPGYDWKCKDCRKFDEIYIEKEVKDGIKKKN